MRTLSLLRRRDPRWEEDGPVARREYRHRLAREVAAFGTSWFAAALSMGVLASQLVGMRLVHG
jgi:hypothetical protein